MVLNSIEARPVKIPTSYNKGVVFRMVVDTKKMKAYKISLTMIRDKIIESLYENNIKQVLMSLEFEHIIDILVHRAIISKDINIYVFGLVKFVIFPIQIFGVKGIHHAIVRNDEVRTKDSNLMNILGFDFVDVELSISNSAVDILGCLVIEVARNVLVRELLKVLKGNVRFDNKCINLIVDFMTNKDKVVPMNISRMVKRCHSCFTRASKKQNIRFL